METLHFNREKTGLFTNISNQLSYNQASLSKYIHLPFSKENFKKQIELKEKSFTSNQREILYNVLKEKYKSVPVSEKVTANLDLLKQNNTFTVTTGHQLSLFTGPIYFIYKILHTIRLSEELNKEYPEVNFVPVFWMASEDHDFEEIQSIQLFNKTIKWETDQKGPVGRFDIESFESIKKEFAELFENNPESELLKLLESYEGKNLGEATFKLVNQLFKDYGLIIVDGDDKQLKTEFKSTFEKEIKTQFSYNEVTKTSESLQEEGVKLQITPREINLFYIENNLRSRIQTIEDNYFIEEKGTFTQVELLELLEKQPESFSPNVVLRPLYQETILPNLCYLGGGGEMTYWLQLKGVFDSAQIPFPLIQVRNSFLQIDSGSLKRLEKINLTIDEIFNSTEELKKNYVLKNSANELNFENIDKSFSEFCDTISKQIIQVDTNLKSYSEAEISRLEKQLISIKQKLIKTEKNKHENSLNQIEQLKNKLFPNGGLQERSMNFFSICSDGNVYSHLNEIYNSIDAFGNDLIIIK
jgi:bacillithiol biosynthesis cysteine-adding enzyme BshC